jgi:DNA-binding NarL/FixJ family response regulator
VRVLVVDDSAPVRARLAALLGEVPGVGEILQASGTSDAIAIVRHRQPHVVLLDLHLGVESGLALVPSALAGQPGAVLIVVTNLPTEHHRRECLARGVAHFFDKSGDLEPVLRLVQQAASDLHPIAEGKTSDTSGAGRPIPDSADGT